MAEPRRRLETLRAGAPLRVGSATLLLIERSEVLAELGARGAWLSAVKEPYALVLRDGEGVRAFPAGAAAVTLEELRERIPELEALLGLA